MNAPPMLRLLDTDQDFGFSLVDDTAASTASAKGASGPSAAALQVEAPALELARLDGEFNLSLVDEAQVAKTCRVLVGLLSGDALDDAGEVAARARELAAAAPDVRVWLSVQDGWAVHRLEGTVGATDAVARSIERDPRLQGVQRLQARPDGTEVTGVAAGGSTAWIYGGRDRSTRGHLAARVRRAMSGTDDAAVLWRDLCLPPAGEPSADPPAGDIRPLVLLCASPTQADRLAAAWGAAVEAASGRIRIRELMVGVAGQPRPRGTAVRVADRCDRHGARCAPLVIGVIDDADLLQPLLQGARAVVAMPRRGRPAATAWLRQVPPAAACIGISRDTDLHRQLIRDAGAGGRTYRVADLDPADEGLVARRLLGYIATGRWTSR
jgi:hypothetical protein